MTFGEKRAIIRKAKSLMQSLRQQVNGFDLEAFPDSLNLPREDFEALEFGLSKLLKAWTAVTDDPDGPRELKRVNMLFTRPDGTMNILFKSIPVRMQEPYGWQRG